MMASGDDEDRYDEFVSWLQDEFAELDHTRRAYIVAESAGRIMAFVRVWHSPHIDEWVIDGMVVSPPHRGRGVGSALLGEALALAGEMGAASVIVQASKSAPRALAFYARAGFTRETTEYLNSYGRPRKDIGWQCRIALPPRQSPTRTASTPQED